MIMTKVVLNLGNTFQSRNRLASWAGETQVLFHLVDTFQVHREKVARHKRHTDGGFVVQAARRKQDSGRKGEKGKERQAGERSPSLAMAVKKPYARQPVTHLAQTLRAL